MALDSCGHEFSSLLPPNSTQLERDLERVHTLCPFDEPVGRISRAKLDAVPSYVPWLIWEYGLGEILPYLPDPENAISDGLMWQRLRGTPRSLSIALGWLGVDAAAEQEVPGAHFAEFMLKVEGVPSNETLRYMEDLANLSKPARSRLVRVFNSAYDIRPIEWDTEFTWDGDSFWDDYSGSPVEGLDANYSLGANYAVSTGPAALYSSASSCKSKVRSLLVSSGADYFSYDSGLWDDAVIEPARVGVTVSKAKSPVKAEGRTIWGGMNHATYDSYRGMIYTASTKRTSETV